MTKGKTEIKKGTIVTIIGDSCFAGKQGRVLYLKKEDVIVELPKKGLIMSRAPFFRKDLRIDEDWAPENKALITFEDFKLFIPFTGTLTECAHEDCKKIPVQTILVRHNGNVMELPACPDHVKCNGKCAICLKIRVSC
ncbi:MAG: hypothetical protein PHD31_00860 [Candidatus Pacebacteria bacterium]|nr:hypothetical protein [Candidatus Paceibacterota bacterium]